MSMTTMVKEEILSLLQDGKEHSAAEIKSVIRAKHPKEEITEGVFANALRTMTIAGKCENIDRGTYRIGGNGKNEKKQHSNSQQKVPCQELKKEVLKMTNDMRKAFGDMIKNVDMSVDDSELLQYILRVRLAFDEFENEIGK